MSRYSIQSGEKGVKQHTRELDNDTIRRIAELQEDLNEFKRSEKKYRDSGHTSLEHEARFQYELCSDEIEDLLNPPPPRPSKGDSWWSLICLPCLICFSCFCWISTAEVGEFNKNKRRNAHIASEFTQLGRDIVSMKKKKSSNTSPSST